MDYRGVQVLHCEVMLTLNVSVLLQENGNAAKHYPPRLSVSAGLIKKGCMGVCSMV